MKLIPLIPKLRFLDLHLSISNDIISTKIYDKHDDFDFEIVNFPFLDGDVPHSQLIRFARAFSHVADFNTRNKLLTQKFLKQGYWYHRLCETFSKFSRRYYDLISKFQVGLGLPVGFLLLWYMYIVLFTVESLYLLHLFLYIDLYVLGDDALIS